mmetsp:Transcript_142459/g.265527  ORF Transcript_142459/g.265527 Transcript_142459/m.265527 type:complete len:138 (-) Transcript_142459:3010-3423(-)
MPWGTQAGTVSDLNGTSTGVVVTGSLDCCRKYAVVLHKEFRLYAKPATGAIASMARAAKKDHVGASRAPADFSDFSDRPYFLLTFFSSFLISRRWVRRESLAEGPLKHSQTGSGTSDSRPNVSEVHSIEPSAFTVEV